jgi:inner membrane protein
MLIRTHLAITVFGILVFLDNFSSVESKIIFILFALAATYIPDVDHKNSKLGKYWIFRPFQWFVKHRNFVHSLLFMLLIGFGIFIFSKVAAYGFLLGYGLHLIADCFTVSGIRMFWPLKFKFRGFVRTNGIFEWIVFGLFFVLDLVFLLRILMNFFGP